MVNIDKMAPFNPYTLRTLRMGFLSILLIANSSIYASTQFVIKTEAVRGDQKSTRTERIILDGENGRIDVVEKDGKLNPGLAYMLTTDGGKTWLIADNKKTVCSNWDTKQFFNTAGALLNKYSRIINAKVVSSRVEVLENKPAPKMLGKKVRFLKIASHLRMRGSFLVFSADYKLEFTDHVWFSPELPVDPIERSWIEASVNTGYPHIDALYGAWEKNITGVIFKQVRRTILTDVKKNKVTTDKTETVTMQSISHLDRSTLPKGLFIKPGCSDVGEKEQTKEIKDMLQEIVK